MTTLERRRGAEPESGALAKQRFNAPKSAEKAEKKPVPLVDISSTEIRKAIARGEDVSKLLM